MARTETRIFAPGALPTASAKLSGKTQIFHGLPVPIQRPARTLADFAVDGPKTRLMPIEELLQLANAPPKGATSATGGWQSRLRLGPMPRGRKLRLVVGLIALAIVGHASLDVRASTAPLVSREDAAPSLVSQPETLAPAPAKVATVPAEESKASTRKARRAREATSKPASPRRASDLLAAGELTRAAKAYEQLAVSAPQDPVYAEAARILRLRVARPAP